MHAMDDDEQQTIRRERVGAHAWVRSPEPVDLRHDGLATAVARRRIRRRYA